VLALPLFVLALAIVAGAVVGNAAGTGVREALLALRTPLTLLVLPLAIVNLDLPRRRVVQLVTGAAVLAIVKAILGIAVVATGRGSIVDGTTLSYYEPAANWAILAALLGIVALWLAGARPPPWALLGVPLLVASLGLSYRRSFWIGGVLALLLVLLVGTSPARRRVLVPAAALTVLAVWGLWSWGVHSDAPIVKRAASLAPAQLQANAEDRYRLDERANVLAEIRREPVTGLGIGVPWRATERPLSVNHDEGRQYVHASGLWFWLKLGVLGLAAYAATMLAALVLAWRTWRRSPEPVLRAFGLASLAGIVGLLVVETTASFTGVETRFTVVIAAQIGLLAAAASPR
jgi:hypothetical protein